MPFPDQDWISQAIAQADRHLGAGQLQQADAICRQIVSANPQHARALHMLGFIALRTGRAAQAIELLDRSLAVAPNDAHARLHRGSALLMARHFEQLISAMRELISQHPNLAAAYSLLAVAMYESGQIPEAMKMFVESVVRGPKDPENFSNYAKALYHSGENDQAIAAAKKAIALQATLSEPYLHLGNALHANGLIKDALAAYRKGLAVKPDWNRCASNILYAIHFDPEADGQAIYIEHVGWNTKYASSLQKSIAPHTNERSPGRRLRIGYFSPDFREHCQSFFTIPLLSKHDRRQFEIYCYSDVAQPDAVTERIRGYADAWRSIVGINDARVAEMIRADQIDILVDLSMHMDRGRPLLMARKPAPIQIAWLAYPGTTGLNAMDYRLTDPWLDPPGLNDPFYVEKSIRLPHTFWCYDPLCDEPAVNALPADDMGCITFGCLNNFIKINDVVLAMWSRVLQEVPDSRLIMLAPCGSARQRVLDGLQIDPQRIEFLDRQPRGKYLALYHRIDLCLDTFPYNGHTTSLDALWMGVPVVSYYGQTAVSRAGLSQSSNLGLPELATDSRDEYVKIAVSLANDRPRLRELRATLRQRMRNSPLMDGRAFARGMEEIFRLLWQRWRVATPEDTGSSPNPAVLLKEGNAHLQAGRIDESISSLRRAIELQPDFADAHTSLGVALFQSKQPEAAQRALEQAISLNPKSVDALNNLALVLLASKKTDEAISMLQSAIRTDPNHPRPHFNLGDAYYLKGEWAKAIESFEIAIRLNPNWADSHYAMGRSLKELGRLDEAIVAYRHAIRIKPSHAGAHSSLGTALNEVGRLDEALAEFRIAARIPPGSPLALSNFVFTMPFHPDYDLPRMHEELARWNRTFALPLQKTIRRHSNDRTPDRRLRIGYVSPHFRQHCQAFFTLPLFSRHDHSQFEIHCYTNVVGTDAVTERIKSYADVWRVTNNIDDAELAEMIFDDRIDILIDLAMQMDGGRPLLFARKPAPIQVAWLAYPGSTGLTAMDYRLTDPYLDPPGKNDEYYSEETIRLPHTFWCYNALSTGAAVNALPADEAGHITFGCLNSFFKTNDLVFRMWSQVLRQVPDSRLILMAPQGIVRRRVLDQLGIDAGRVEFVERQAHGPYMETYQRIDVCLDTFPYNGHTTSLDALWMGVPVLSRYGHTPFSRAGLSQASNLGLTDLVTESPEEFVNLAVSLANDRPRLRELRASLRTRMQKSPLTNSTLFARHIEHVYRSIWRRWCQNPPK